MNGWARRAELGEKALETIAKGLEEWHGTGSRLGLSYFLYLHADAALCLGQTAKAESLVAEAQAFEEESGEAFWKPELLRLRGEIALAGADEAAAATHFREAVATAHGMALFAPELRAAMALARLAGDGPAPDSGRCRAAPGLEMRGQGRSCRCRGA